MPNVENYSVDEVWECHLDDYYHFAEPLGGLLAKALSYIPKEDTDSVLEKVFFIQQNCRSEYFSPSLVRQRAVILVYSEDLEVEQEAVVTILHEAGHAFLGHGESKTIDAAAYELEYEREEDECWEQVRKWLPNEFHNIIQKQELNGGGSHGKGYMA